MLRINADFDQPVCVDSSRLPWLDSPMAGVQRRMLYREGDEVAKATSIVRYAPSSYFSRHRHNGGEEFYVLEGVFSDEHGDYPRGSYVRNPVGSDHQPHSVTGCVILVRLWQMAAQDQSYLRINTLDALWQPSSRRGEDLLPLHEFATEKNYLLRQGEAQALVRETAGSISLDTKVRQQLPLVEIFVLNGPFIWAQQQYPCATWLRFPP